MKKTYFAFCIHNHQPEGNFESVLEDAYKDSYWPFLKIIAKHPAIKLTLHTTGYLLDWMAEEHPEYIELLRDMVSAGQVELMGGGFYEPVLSVIPEEDRIAQLRLMSDRLYSLFGKRPRGIWLAERVWEPTLPTTLVKAGVEYLLVDDYHFIKAGLAKEDLGGYYVTEDQGNVVRVFPGSEMLRYLVPFQPIERLDAHLRGLESFLKRGRAAIYGDDGEKFGVWPGTHKLVYDGGWLESFFTRIEELAGDGLVPATFSELMDAEKPLGRVYLPTTSYMEMGEWSLPHEAARAYGRLVDELKEWNDGARVRRFLQGGTWRSFCAKYPEANWMHKRMLMASRAVNAANGAARAKALPHLYKAQCNDAYWHGIFGGLYLPHLRTKVYENLIKAEEAAGAVRAVGPERVDMDADGHDEVVLRSRDLSLFIAPAQGASLVELDYKPRSVNLLNTLTRWPEGYHHKLTERKADAAGGAASIHDVVLVKEEGLESHLKSDLLRRTSFIDRFLSYGETLENFAAHTHADLGDFHGAPYGIDLSGRSALFTRAGSVNGVEVRLSKEYATVGTDSFTVTYKAVNVGAGPLDAVRFGVELNVLLPCCNGPACYYRMHASGGAAKVDDIGLGSTGELASVRRVGMVDDLTGVELTIEAGLDATLWRHPVYTVSLSEAGFEKIFQGSCLLFLFPLRLEPGASMEVVFTVKTSVFKG